jgi:AcrR family transcriptional regulator
MARQQDEEKKKKILQAAIRSFGELGYDTTTMKDIAQEANIAPGSIYTYFKDKAVLFIATVNTVWKEFYAGLDKIAQSAQGFDNRMDALMDYGFDLLVNLHPIVRGMYQEANRLDIFHKNMNRLSKRLVEFFAAADSKNEPLSFKDPDTQQYLVKVWISGILFTLASVPTHRIKNEVVHMKRALREKFLFPIQPEPSGK